MRAGAEALAGTCQFRCQGLVSGQLSRNTCRKWWMRRELKTSGQVSEWSSPLSEYLIMCGGKSRNGTQAIETANSTSTPSTLAGHKTQCNRIPKLFQWLLPLSHRHLSALIHDKLSHLIHDKSSEGPIETRRWRAGGGGGEHKRMEDEGRGQARGEYCSLPEWSGSCCPVFCL